MVPSFQDVEHAQRELAERGAVFGARVLRFEWLYREIAARAGYREPVASEVQRELLLEAARRAARGLSVLAESAARPGFVRAAARFVAELGRARVDPGRFTQALRAWAGDGPRRAYADEVAADLRRLPRARSSGAGLVDPELFAWRALDALRLEPDALGRRPRSSSTASTTSPSSSSTRSRRWPSRCGAHVYVSLPFEPGGRRSGPPPAVHARLSELATERIELAAVDDHYAAGSRAALHQVERGLFETDPPRAGGGRRRDRLPLGRRARGPRWSWRRRGCSTCCAAAPRPATWRWCSATRRATPRSWSRCSAPTACPTRSTARCRSPTPALGRGLLALIRCARRGGQRRRPPRLPAHSRAPEAAGARRPARGARAPGGRPQRRARPRHLGARALELDGPRPARRRRHDTAAVRGRAAGGAGAPVHRALPPPRAGAGRPRAGRPARVRAPGAGARRAGARWWSRGRRVDRRRVAAGARRA